jgi:four helix bundle protein
MEAFEKLVVWQRAMDLVERVYALSRAFPSDERFGLTSQLCRASVSVPANIAEGYGRTHRGDYLHHLSMARGSLMEIETHLKIAVRLRFVTEEAMRPSWDNAQEVGRLLTALIASLQEPRKG